MKMFLIVGIVFHGLIHFLGFARLWHVPSPKNFTGHTLFLISESIQKPLGLIWLGAMVLFILTAILIFAGNSYWWVSAGGAILISQILIIVHWKDAKAGTIVNLILCIPSVVAFGSWQFNENVIEEIKRITTTGNGIVLNHPVTETAMEGMPECVQKWLSISGVVSQEGVSTVHLKQKGVIRTAPDGEWMPVSAEQFFDVRNPAFVWKAKVHMNKMIWYSGRDKLENGKGNMLIKLYALLPVVNGSGPEIDQGTLLRFLGELCWFPSAATSPYISWEPAGDLSAKATLRYRNTTVSGIFSFDVNGNIRSFQAKRFMMLNGLTTLEDWWVTCKAWKKMNGFVIPVKGEVTWKLKDGIFTYYRWEISEIEYH